LIFEREDLLAPLLAGMEKPPHAMAPGKNEQDYYEGTVLGSPSTNPTKDTDSK
jgi:hypothetical protein